MSSSSSNFGAFATPLPACDAWGNIRLGTSAVSTTLVNGSGISAVQRTATGLHGISFSSPSRFGGGAYVFLVTPEYSSHTIGPFVVSGVKAGGVTAPGFSAGFALSCYGFQTPAVAGGFTINGPVDTTANTVWANVAAFAFKRNTDIRSTEVSNYLNYSENFANWTQTDSATRFVLATDQVAPNGSTNVFVYTGHSATNNFVSQSAPFVNKVGTYSVHAKPGSGVTLQMLIGGGGNNFGYVVNTVTDAMVASGTVPSGGSLTGSVQSLSDGWKRIRLTFSSPNLAAPIVRANPSDMNGKTIYVWGAQLEEGSLATQYVKTEAVSPVLGDQDEKKQFVPGVAGYGLTGATYTSSITALNPVRTPTAYGTIVVPPFKTPTNNAPVIAYTEGSSNISGISAGANSTFDVFFAKPMKTSDYCVILSAEVQPAGNSPDYSTANEYPILFIDRTFKTVNGFRVTSLRQNTTTNEFTRSAAHYQNGLKEKIHFMVFGGGTYGQE